MNDLNRSLVLWAFLAPVLVACGGGGGGGSGVSVSDGNGNGENNFADLPFPVWIVDPPTARQVVSGSQVPTLTDDQAQQKIDTIINAGNTLVISDVVRIMGPSPLPERITHDCSGATCISTSDDDSEVINLSDPDTSDRTMFRVVMTYNGITLGQQVSRDNTGEINQSDTLSYGGWLEHSAFSVGIVYFPGANAIAETRDIAAGGESYGFSLETNPTALSDRTATWEGVMVGVGHEDHNGETIYQGDAMVEVDFNNMDADVTFSNINELYARDSIIGSWTWTDIPIDNGTFSQGSGSDQIEGRFYGSSHEEVGGIFEREDVVGAFGARRGTQ